MYTFFHSPCCCKIISLPIFSKVHRHSKIRVLSSLYFKSVGLHAWISSTSYRKVFQLLKTFFLIFISVNVCNILFCYFWIKWYSGVFYWLFVQEGEKSVLSHHAHVHLSTPTPPTVRIYSIHWVQSIFWCMDQMCLHYHTTFIGFFWKLKIAFCFYLLNVLCTSRSTGKSFNTFAKYLKNFPTIQRIFFPRNF